MPIGTLFIEPEWYRSAEGKEYISGIINKNTGMRKPFALLEKPVYPLSATPEVFEYKIFVSGKAGVGKTSAVAKLSANTVPRTYCQTPGIQTSTVYWPAKVTEVNRVVMFKLRLWDAGETALGNFDHLLPACKEQLDAVLYVFSFVDKSSFSDLPHRMTRVLGSEQDVCQLVLGTKLDLQSENEVTQRDIADFEAQWKLRTLSLGRIFPGSRTKSDIADIAPTLNFICDQLWQRDQMLGDLRNSSNT